MTTTGLELRMHEGQERTSVSRFTTTLNEVVRSLREIDRVYLQRATRATWVMADLAREQNDMIVRLEARPSNGSRPSSDMLVPVDALISGASILHDQAEVPRLFMPATVERLADLSEPGDGLQGLSIAAYNGKAGTEVEINDQVRVNARSAVMAHEISYGSVFGLLDSLGHRRRAGGTKVAIHDPSTRRVIDGFLPESLTEEARELWRHRVLARGKIRRNRSGQVIRIDVDHIEPLPEDNRNRPDTRDLLGAAPDWLGGHSVDDFIREVRGG